MMRKAPVRSVVELWRILPSGIESFNDQQGA
jgi:hypothetical protein